MNNYYFSCVLFAIIVIGSRILLSELYAEDIVTEGQTPFQLSSLYVGYLYPIPVGEQWRIIDINGNPVGDTVWNEYVPPFRRNLRYAFVSKEDKWYRIVSTGKTFPLDIPAGYNLLADLGQGLIILGSDRTKYLNYSHVYNIVIDTFIGESFFVPVLGGRGDGLLPIAIRTGEIPNPEDIHFPIFKQTINLLDLKTGERLLDDNEKFTTGHVSEGIINFTVADPSGNYSYLVNRRGENISPRPNERLGMGAFRNGVAWCYFLDESSKGPVLIDRSGAILAQGYITISDNFYGMSRVIPGEGNTFSDGRDFFGFVNTLGNEIIPSQYYAASHFRDGMALVQKNECRKFYIINSFGDVLYQLDGLPDIRRFSFSSLENFWRTGVFIREQDNGTLQLINIDGTVLYETHQESGFLGRWPLGNVTVRF